MHSFPELAVVGVDQRRTPSAVVKHGLVHWAHLGGKIAERAYSPAYAKTIFMTRFSARFALLAVLFRLEASTNIGMP